MKQNKINKAWNKLGKMEGYFPSEKVGYIYI